jgi:hypothetical protein
MMERALCRESASRIWQKHRMAAGRVLVDVQGAPTAIIRAGKIAIFPISPLSSVIARQA